MTTPAEAGRGEGMDWTGWADSDLRAELARREAVWAKAGEDLLKARYADTCAEADATEVRRELESRHPDVGESFPDVPCYSPEGFRWHENGVHVMWRCPTCGLGSVGLECVVPEGAQSMHCRCGRVEKVPRLVGLPGWGQ